jgi:hypothetical protein
MPRARTRSRLIKRSQRSPRQRHANHETSLLERRTVCALWDKKPKMKRPKGFPNPSGLG